MSEKTIKHLCSCNEKTRNNHLSSSYSLYNLMNQHSDISKESKTKIDDGVKEILRRQIYDDKKNSEEVFNSIIDAVIIAPTVGSIAASVPDFLGFNESQAKVISELATKLYRIRNFF